MSASRRAKRHMNLMSVIVFVACLLLVGGNTVFAVPYLQLDAQPADYVDFDEESIVTSSLQFTLYTLVNSTDSSFANDLSQSNFWVSVAIVPDPGDPDDLGSYEFDGKIFNVTQGGADYDPMEYGVPPLEEFLQQNSLPSHGIYDTYYREHQVFLDPTKLQILYNSQDFPGGPDQFDPNPNPEGDLWYQAFEVDATGLEYPPYRLHFDFYTTDAETGYITAFAPFSHDVLATPIPASVILGILGLGVVGLKLRKFA